MDTGAKPSQPSSRLLLATAVICGLTIAWACHDRTERVARFELTEGSAEVTEVNSVSVSPLPELEAWPSGSDALVRAAPLQPVPPSPPGPDGWGPEFAKLPESPPGEPYVTPTLPMTFEPELPPEIVVAAPPLETEAPMFDESVLEQLPDLDTPSLEALLPEEIGFDAQTPWREEEPLLSDEDLAEIEEELLSGFSQEATQPVELEDAPAEYHDEAAALAADTPADELLTYTPAASEISHRVMADVQAAFTLGRHGALYAARQKFIEVMGVIAGAKDGQRSTDRHTRALAEGLQALEEARDFLPGGAVSKELTVAEAAASHRTPMLRNTSRAIKTLPQEAAALYYRFAEHKLAKAVENEQAGSMALYGLGKIHAQLYRFDSLAVDQQKSLAMHRAALLTHKANHLAANELGVGLAKVGRYEPSAAVLQRAIACGGGSTVYRNLAHVQNKLGQTDLARVTNERAERLAMQERAAGLFSRERGVQWVTPDKLAGRPEAEVFTRPAMAPRQAAAAPQQPGAAPNRVSRFAIRQLPSHSMNDQPAAPRQPRYTPHQQAAAHAPTSDISRFAKRRLPSQAPVEQARVNPDRVVPFQANREAAPAVSQTTLQ